MLTRYLVYKQDDVGPDYPETAMIDFDKASAKFVEYLRMCGSKDEADISMDREDHYKPMYRAVALLVAPSHPFIDEVLSGERPTLEQAVAILWHADPCS